MTEVSVWLPPALSKKTCLEAREGKEARMAAMSAIVGGRGWGGRDRGAAAAGVVSERGWGKVLLGVRGEEGTINGLKARKGLAVGEGRCGSWF